MGRAEAEWLAHYASPYYDPQKAHDYYMRTRKLTPRAPATTQAQKEGLKYAGDKLTANRKAELKKLADKTNRTVSTTQARAAASRKKLTAKAKALRIQVIKRQMDNILKIPKGASPEEIVRIGKANRSEMARAKAKAASDLQKVNQRAQAIIERARKSYKTGNASINKRYDVATKRETTNIRAHVR